MTKIKRLEHPKPQFERADWENLNGLWQFEIDYGNSGKARKRYEADCVYPTQINVPFCPESELSGIGNKDFMNSLWYRRSITVTKEQLAGCIILHFGGVDYRCTCYINGKEVGTHKGGFVSFSFDITNALHEGENQIVAHAEDDVRDPMVPRGKQSEEFASHGCDYTRTTGIWQTVWLEFKPKTNIECVKYYPDIKGSVTVEATLNGSATLQMLVTYEGREMAQKTVFSMGGSERFTVDLAETHLWEPGNGRLYDVVFTYGKDMVKSYFGLRSIRIDRKKCLINEKPVFQRLVLDQGFYPDGIWTAPSDKALVRDIELSMAMGFNGARLHQKVFEERFLYHCDRKGYIVWGEYGSWGLDTTDQYAIYSFLPEWMEIINRDFNHPAIVGWCPFNETWFVAGKGQPKHEIIRLAYDVTKAMDQTRPCIDASGGYHVKTDIYDVHDYQPDAEAFSECFCKLESENILSNFCNENQTAYAGEPVFVSEYGGIKWAEDANDRNAWGYGDVPKTLDEFLSRLKNLTDVLLDNPAICGFCYTQLVDVEQEQNGLYTYDRRAKFDPAVISVIFSRKAAIENIYYKFGIGGSGQ